MFHKALIYKIILITMGLVGCMGPTAVGPLPYFNHDGPNNEIAETRELCLLYSRFGFTDGNCGDSSWSLRRFSQADLGSVEFQSARNELQNSILALSDDMCGSFRNDLEKKSRNQLLGSESFALVLSAGAAIGGSEQMAKGLATLAAAATGYGQLIDDEYVNDLQNTQQGIALARRKVSLQIFSQQDKNLLEYSLSRAIYDAYRYHGVCNVSDGNSETQKSINEEFSELLTDNQLLES
ncbi:MAG: hypothetical protein OXD01_09745 [Gammaproteobacteria bacterium]|nr:hypothetical protein [Gammaproteobacteria bacterium]